MTVEIDAEVRTGNFSMRVQARLDQPATGVFGPSGAGKTILLHLIAGLARPSAGRVAVDGEVLDDVDRGIHVPAHRRRIGLVFQHGRLFPHLSVADNLRYGERLLAANARKIGFDALVDLLGLGPLLERRPSSLSGGERQRVALGRALLASPRLLLLDEPIASLDRGLKKQILPYLRRVRAQLGIPLIHVSHDLGELLHLTDHLLLLERGAVVALGRLTDLVANPDHLARLHDFGLVNLLRGTIAGHAPADGMTMITLSGGQVMRASLQDEPPGAACDLLIRPEDVILARAPMAGLSVQNQLRGRVTAVTRTPARTIVGVDIGQPLLAEILLAEISGKAYSELNFAVGAEVWCLCKAQSVLVA